jgi:hypothetical protein
MPEDKYTVNRTEDSAGSILADTDDGREMLSMNLPSGSASDDQGPCLYLGPSGQRCNRRAVEGGFCALHQPGAVAAKIAKPSKIVAAILGILGALWPFVSDFIREILRFLHPH